MAQEERLEQLCSCRARFGYLLVFLPTFRPPAKFLLHRCKQLSTSFCDTTGNCSCLSADCGTCVRMCPFVLRLYDNGDFVSPKARPSFFLLSPGFRTGSLRCSCACYSASDTTRYSLQTFRIPVTSSRRGSSVTLDIMRVIKNYIIYIVPSGASHAETQQLRFLEDLVGKHYGRSVARAGKSDLNDTRCLE